MRRPHVVLSLVFLFGSVLAAQAPAAELDGPAHDFTLKSRGGENHKLSEHIGDVVMINFWASWCGPCRQEMPLLDDLYRRYQSLGFTLLGVNVEEDSAQAERILKEIPVSFPILFDAEHKVSKLYDVIAMPSTVLVDRDGNLRYLHKGYLPGYEVEYEQQVKALLLE